MWVLFKIVGFSHGFYFKNKQSFYLYKIIISGYNEKP